MHFAAPVAFAVVASSILGLTAPVPNSHPQVTPKRDDDDFFTHPYIIRYERSSDRVLDSATPKRDDNSIDQNKRSTPLPAGGVQGTGSNSNQGIASDNNQGIASDTGRRSGIDGTSNLAPGNSFQ